MANSTQQRIIFHDSFEGKGFTDENSLANAYLTKPDEIIPVITHLQGREENKFPLTFLTEGKTGGREFVELNDIQYTWKTMRRLRKSDVVVSTPYSSTDKPGINNTNFIITFDSDWLKNQHTVVSPNGTMARIMGEPVRVGAHYQYSLQLFTTNPAEYVSYSELTAGVRWAMEGGANVSEALSMGNKSNVQFPGAIKNQLGIIRKSYNIVGNIANKVVECQFNINGQVTRYWMDFEKWQHDLTWKQDCEENLWFSKYNRMSNGVIAMKDPDTGLPIPSAAGLIDQIPHEDTYSFLSTKKLKNTVLDVTYGITDAPTDIVLYTGVGGAEEFHNACLESASGIQIIGDKFVTGSDMSLMLGGYFNRYKTPQGVVITVKQLHLNDYGSRAEVAPRHPISNLPMTSYDMYFVDQSKYEGQNNLVMVTQKGRSYIEGYEKGMAAMREMGIQIPDGLVTTEQDKSAVHKMAAKGIAIRRNTHCFKLSCDLS
jgi:hypothetical protein